MASSPLQTRAQRKRIQLKKQQEAMRFHHLTVCQVCRKPRALWKSCDPRGDMQCVDCQKAGRTTQLTRRAFAQALPDRLYWHYLKERALWFMLQEAAEDAEEYEPPLFEEEMDVQSSVL
jgi:hypothetical protein